MGSVSSQSQEIKIVSGSSEITSNFSSKQIGILVLARLRIRETCQENIAAILDGTNHRADRRVMQFLRDYVPLYSCEAHIRDGFRRVMPFDNLDNFLQVCTALSSDRRANVCSPPPHLTEDEALAVMAYTYGPAINPITQDLFYVVFNNKLREWDPDQMELLRPYLFYLLQGLMKLPVFSGDVFRGIPVSALNTVRDNYKRGTVVEWSAVSSTTTSIDIARAFAGQGGIIFHISCLTGRSVVEYSYYETEAEITILPNTKFVVSAAVEFDLQTGYYIVRMTECGDEFLF